LFADNTIERIRKFWSVDKSKLYMKDQIIDYAKTDIEFLINEYDEMKKILNLLDAIEINFNKDVN
jgi:hypothetical protein